MERGPNIAPSLHSPHLSINIFNNNLTIITEESAGPANYSTPAATTGSVTQIGLLETIHFCKFCWSVGYDEPPHMAPGHHTSHGARTPSRDRSSELGAFLRAGPHPKNVSTLVEVNYTASSHTLCHTRN